MNMRKIPYPPRLRNVLLKKTATVIGKLRYHFFNLTEKEIKDWNNIFSSLLKMPPRTHFKIAKGMVNAPPWHVSKMGFSKRALRQFRSDHQFKGIHIREYKDCYVAHIDFYNPSRNLFKHWAYYVPKYFI